MATTLQAKIESLGEKLREENKSRECELLEKNDERSTCSKKTHLSLDFDASTRQPRPGKWIEVVYATMRRLSEVLVCSYETACEELSLFISEKKHLHFCNKSHLWSRYFNGRIPAFVSIKELVLFVSFHLQTWIKLSRFFFLSIVIVHLRVNENFVTATPYWHSINHMDLKWYVNNTMLTDANWEEFSLIIWLKRF